MDNSKAMTFEEYLAGLPMDGPGHSIIQDVISSENGVSDSVISFKAVIPAVVDSELLCATALRWRNVQEHFLRDVRVYALSPNPKTEKYMQSLLSVDCRVYLTPIPIELREVFDEH